MNYASSRLVPGALVFAGVLLTAGGAGAAPIFAINFQNYAPGPLRSPWFGSQAGPSTGTVQNVGGGNTAVLVRGSTGDGAFLTYSTSIPATSTDLHVDFDLYPVGGASPLFTLFGSGYSNAKKLRVWRDPSTRALTASSASGNVICGTLAGDRWSRITLQVHVAAPRSFDVLVNGAATGCTAVPTQLGTPFRGIGIMDASNVGWGGDAYFDNFVGY